MNRQFTECAIGVRAHALEELGAAVAQRIAGHHTIVIKNAVAGPSYDSRGVCDDQSSAFEIEKM